MSYANFGREPTLLLAWLEREAKIDHAVLRMRHGVRYAGIGAQQIGRAETRTPGRWVKGSRSGNTL